MQGGFSINNDTQRTEIDFDANIQKKKERHVTTESGDKKLGL